MSPAVKRPADHRRWGRQRSATLNRPLALVAAAALFMENLDGTIIQTSAPAMARSFSVAPVDLNLAMTAYLLTVAVCVPVSGWCADRFGVRRVFMVALVGFTLASVLCALSVNLTELTVARILQGIGGAMMVPVGRLAVLRDLDRRDLLDAMAYLTWPSLLAPVVAPALGGVLTDTLGWEWIFLINVPFGVLVLVVAGRIINAGPVPDVGRLDWAGFALTGVCLALLVHGVEQFADSGGGAPWAAASIGVAAGAGLLAVWWMRRSDHPLLDFSALRVATFRVGNVGGGVYRLTITAAPFLFALLFEVGFGWSAARAGLIVGAIFLGNIAIKPLTTPLIRNLGFKTVIVGSNLAGILVYAGCVFVTASTQLWVVVSLLFASGVFRSIGFSGYNSLQFSDVPTNQVNGANTLASTMQQVATGLGVAVAALIVRVAGSVAAGAGRHDLATGYRWAFAGVALLLLFPLIEAALLHRRAGAGALS